MNDLLPSLAESLLLVLALSMDSFVASFAYGTNHIRIPLSSTIVISTVCSAILGLSLLAGVLIRPFVPGELVKAVCFFILLALGLVKVFDSSLKAAIRRRKHIRRDFTFSALHLNFILTVYADPRAGGPGPFPPAFPRRGVLAGCALSLDGLAVGFGAALGSVGVWQSRFFPCSSARAPCGWGHFSATGWRPAPLWTFPGSAACCCWPSPF